LLLVLGGVGCSRGLAPVTPHDDREPAAAGSASQVREEPLLIDVRTPQEYAGGHIKGAVNIPYDQLEARSDELPEEKNREIVVYCRSGQRSAIAVRTLRRLGYGRLRDEGSYERLKAKK